MNATIKQNETPSRTMMYALPLEMLDIILQKSYLHWIMDPTAKQRDDEVIRSLISVDVCFYRRITRRRFKKAVWRYLEDFYGKAKKRSAIIRTNRNYFVDNIQPSDELIASLLSLNCITEEQSRLIQRQRSTRDKNNELLYVIESVDERNFSNVVKCLWNTNHKTATKIIENGGVERSISINFTHRIEVQRIGCVFGVTKLRNKIYGLCRTLSFDQVEIHVFEDRTPFRLLKEIKTKEIGLPWDIASSEKENCLYISDNSEQCVWKITIEKDDRHIVIQWLTTDYDPRTLSVSSDGQLLLINDSSHSLMIYGSDAEFIRSIPLPGHNTFHYHAVETSIGNFVVTHTDYKLRTVEEKVEKNDLALEKVEHTNRSDRIDGKVGSNWIRWDTMLVVSELNRDGKTVMRRCIDPNERRHLDHYGYDLSLDSDDRIFMTNSHHNRVGFLDSGLRWNRIRYSARGEKEEWRIRQPFRLCYDEEMKQLIVVGYNTSELNIYTLSLQ